jgi:hypothetical protein
MDRRWPESSRQFRFELDEPSRLSPLIIETTSTIEGWRERRRENPARFRHGSEFNGKASFRGSIRSSKYRSGSQTSTKMPVTSKSQILLSIHRIGSDGFFDLGKLSKFSKFPSAKLQRKFRLFPWTKAARSS